jgi:hypothetical protein
MGRLLLFWHNESLPAEGLTGYRQSEIHSRCLCARPPARSRAAGPTIASRLTARGHHFVTPSGEIELPGGGVAADRSCSPLAVRIHSCVTSRLPLFAISYRVLLNTLNIFERS